MCVGFTRHSHFASHCSIHQTTTGRHTDPSRVSFNLTKLQPPVPNFQRPSTSPSVADYNHMAVFRLPTQWQSPSPTTDQHSDSQSSITRSLSGRLAIRQAHAVLARPSQHHTVGSSATHCVSPSFLCPALPIMQNRTIRNPQQRRPPRPAFHSRWIRLPRPCIPAPGTVSQTKSSQHSTALIAHHPVLGTSCPFPSTTHSCTAPHPDLLRSDAPSPLHNTKPPSPPTLPARYYLTVTSRLFPGVAPIKFGFLARRVKKTYVFLGC